MAEQRRRPLRFWLFALALLLLQGQAVVNFYSTGSVFELVPMQVVIVFLSFGLYLIHPHFRSWLVTRQGKTPAFWVLALLAVAFSRDLVFREVTTESTIPLTQLLTSVLIYLLAFYLSKRREDLHVLFLFVFAGVALSTLFAFYQYGAGMAAPWTKYMRWSPNFRRACGLEGNPVSLAYSVTPVATIALIMGWLTLKQKPIQRTVLVVVAILSAAGLFLADSRSGLVGVVVGSAAGLFFSQNLSKTFFSFILVGALTFFAATPPKQGSSPEDSRFSFSQIRTDVRISDTWAVYTPIVAANPLGASPSQSRWNQWRKAKDLFNLEGPGYAKLAATLEVAPHNGLLTAGYQYGWFGLIVFVAIAIYLFRRSRLALTTGRSLLVAFTAGAVSLLVHMSFHNASPIIGEMRSWFLLGVLASLTYPPAILRTPGRPR